MEERRIRKRRSDRKAPPSGLSLFRLSKPRSKNIFLLACLVQGLFVIFSIMYTFTYHPLLLENNSLEDIFENKLKKETIKDKNDYTNKLAKVGTEVQTAEGKVYWIYRFDKFRNGRERDVTEMMVNSAGEYIYFSKALDYFTEEKPVWFDQITEYETGRFEVFGGRVVRMKTVQINPSLSYGRTGGEEIEEVLDTNVENEYLKLEKGYFMYKTENPFTFELTVSPDLQQMGPGLLIEKTPFLPKITKDKVAVVTTRFEYANFYHSTMNWYDIFLILVVFKINPSHVDIILLDSHPKSKLDNTWETLYGQPFRAGAMSKPVTYREIILNGIGAKSQINAHKLQDLAFVNEYRHFVLNRFTVLDNHKRKCGRLKVTIIWRRNHVAHPRNPSGFISRKIANEEELLKGLKEADKSLVVAGVQLDNLTMHDQLELVTTTDILIGMHGAGLTHTLYLPQTSGVIELYPNYFRPSHAHFRSMAKWRRMPYMLWVNDDRSKDSHDHQTDVSVTVLKEMVIRMKMIICGSI